MSRVVVVGSGPGGAAAAWQLTRLGINVLLLEAGPRFQPGTDYHLSKPDWEQEFPKKPGSQGAYEVAPGQSIKNLPRDLRSWNHLSGLLVDGDRRTSFGYHHVRGLGGSSLHFTGEAHRLNPKSMSMFSDYGVAADWPLSYQELEKHWITAEKISGVAGPKIDKRCPRSGPYPWEAHELSYASKQMVSALGRLGLGYQPNSLAVLPTPSEGRPGCNHCGGCLRGCQIGDKGSVDLTYLQHAQRTGRLTIMENMEVVKFETRGDKIDSVIVYNKGVERRITGEVFILACGAVQSPRILLNSSNKNSPLGLCNESGHVGKNFMETLLWTSSAIASSNWGAHRGLPVDWVSWDFNAPNSIPGVIGGARFGPAQVESDLVGPVSYAQRVVPGWGLSHKKKLRETFGRVISIAGIGESLPNDNSYIGLSDKRDALGMPLAKIHSYIDSAALARIKFMAKTTRDIVNACGVEKIFEEFSSADAFSSTHVFGTCRMAATSNAGVVDRNCKSFRWPNLFIMDASVFPSSGGGESPGLTVQALAIRACELLAKSLKT